MTDQDTILIIICLGQRCVNNQAQTIIPATWLSFTQGMWPGCHLEPSDTGMRGTDVFCQGNKQGRTYESDPLGPDLLEIAAITLWGRLLAYLALC